MNEKELIYSHIYVNGNRPTAIQRFFVVCTISALFFSFFRFLKKNFIQSIHRWFRLSFVSFIFFSIPFRNFERNS